MGDYQYLYVYDSFVEGQTEPGMYSFPVKSKGLFSIPAFQMTWYRLFAFQCVYVPGVYPKLLDFVRRDAVDIFLFIACQHFVVAN